MQAFLQSDPSLTEFSAQICFYSVSLLPVTDTPLNIAVLLQLIIFLSELLVKKHFGKASVGVIKGQVEEKNTNVLYRVIHCFLNKHWTVLQLQFSAGAAGGAGYFIFPQSHR